MIVNGRKCCYNYKGGSKEYLSVHLSTFTLILSSHSPFHGAQLMLHREMERKQHIEMLRLLQEEELYDFM
jgi:hypothetical protein